MGPSLEDLVSPTALIQSQHRVVYFHPWLYQSALRNLLETCTGDRIRATGRHLAAPADSRGEPPVLCAPAPSFQLQLGPARGSSGARPAGGLRWRFWSAIKSVEGHTLNAMKVLFVLGIYNFSSRCWLKTYNV